MKTYLLESGKLYDEVRIVGNGKERTVESDLVKTPEIIDLPARYADKNSRKVRRFINRRNSRLGKEVTYQTTDTIAAVVSPAQ